MSKLAQALDILNNLPKSENIALAHASDLRDTLCVLRKVADFAAEQICVHEETYRGGAIWEICRQCGTKWADDEGGKPDDAGSLPKCINDAYILLSKYDA